PIRKNFIMGAKEGSSYRQDVVAVKSRCWRALTWLRGTLLGSNQLANDGHVDDENQERGNWSGRLDFFLSCLGYAVGLGNVWRFPYLCYKNGGGAFFIPYCIFLFLCGMPVFCMELAIGQFSSSGPLTCWECAPLFRGIGVGMVLVSSLAAIYYNIIISWSLWYLFASFSNPLPWAECGSWSTPLCSGRLHPVTENCNNWANLTAQSNGTCWFSGRDANGTAQSYLYGIYNASLARLHGIFVRASSNDYMNYVALQDKLGSFLHTGPLRWDMSLCLLLAWIIVFLSLSKGIKSSGKVVYFTALFPYAVLIILLIRGVTLPGCGNGLEFYLTPNVTKLSESGVWKDAAVQIFFSLSSSWGGLITLASYNRFKTDCIRDGMLISICNCATSVFAGFVVFSFLGYLAQELNTNVKDVAQSGVGLAFIVYPQALMKLPGSTFWAILFFLMLITLGLDSQFTCVETAVTSILDRWPHLRRYKTLMIMTFCIVVFFLGLSMCTPGGLQLLTVFDDYSGAWKVMVITILECVCIGYVYGVRRFVKDVELLTGPRIAGFLPWRYFRWWWMACWCFLTPVIVGITLVFSWVKFEPSKYDGEPLPLGAQVFGWTLTLGVLTGLFAWSAASVWQMRSDPGQLIRPTRFWDRRWFDSGVRLPTCRDSRSTRGVAITATSIATKLRKSKTKPRLITL
ncbi:hypothetical protein BOX15_Mlig013345g1, partial [Macrostomum lignano]